MFTIEQIKSAHAKVTSGADFPAYIQAIKELGVRNYETFVTDGHTVYNGEDAYTAASPAKYAALIIAADTNAETFKQDLLLHQQGGSDYPTFCRQSADAGIEKWAVDINDMTCTYFDKAGHTILVETIPS